MSSLSLSPRGMPYFPPPPPPGSPFDFVASPLVNNGCSDPFNPAPCIRMVMNTRIGTFATTALVLYDYITTVDAEIAYVWNGKRRWDTCRWMYVLVRYLTVGYFLLKSTLIFVHVPEKVCSAAGMVDLSLSVIIMILISAILASRNWALYDRTWYWLLFIVIFHGAAWTPAILISFRPTGVYAADLEAFRASQAAVSHDAVQSWLLGGCYITGCSTAYMWWGISTVITETGMWAMTAFKLRKNYSMSRLASNIARDGTIYYVIMFGALVAAAVSASEVASAGSRAFVGSAYFIGIRAVACEHTLVRLRGYLSTDNPIIVGTNLRSSSDALPTHARPNVTGASFAFAPTPDFKDEKGKEKEKMVDVEAIGTLRSSELGYFERGYYGSGGSMPSSSAS